MPRVAKKSSSRSKAKKEEEKDDLMEFEKFVAQKQSRQKSNFRGFTVFVLIIFIVALSILLFSDKDKKQAGPKNYVFKTIYLESGQQIYGKVIKEDSLYIYLDDVYYTRTEMVEVPAEEEGGEPQQVERARLVARGNELNNPVGLMQVNRSKVFAIDEMGQDSEILKIINQMKAEQQ